ncbi:hypothetical protein CUB89_04100 [Akkermansia muciniphila]|nr:hypothetical protein CUB89_04100 [Akkermansia muciniphila]
MVFKAASPELGKRLFYNRKQGGLPAWLRKHGCSRERVPAACSWAVTVSAFLSRTSGRRRAAKPTMASAI